MTKNTHAARIAALSAALALSATSVVGTGTALADELFDGPDWTGGYYVPEEDYPTDPGYATAWRSYEVIRLGDRRFFDYGTQGVRVIGKFDGDRILCMSNAKGGQQGCYVKDQKITEFSGYPRTITTDAKIAPFAPVIGFFLALGYKFNNLGTTGAGLSS